MGERVIHHQDYYTLPNGIECLQVIRYFSNNVGNVMKYCWRHGRKHESDLEDIDKAIEDLEKADIYLKDEIELLKETKVRHNK